MILSLLGKPHECDLRRPFLWWRRSLLAIELRRGEPGFESSGEWRMEYAAGFSFVFGLLPGTYSILVVRTLKKQKGY